MIGITVFTIGASHGPAQPIFTDDFSGDRIDAESWLFERGRADIIQNGELVFKLSDAPPAPQYYNELQQQGGERPARGWLLTRDGFARTSGGKVLCMTLDLKLSPYAYFIAGLCAADGTEDAASARGNLQYGYHGNRLDRALWFMQGPRLTHEVPDDPGAARILRLPDPPIPYQVYRVRLELGAVDGALWQYDMGNGWVTGRDTRGDGAGDRSDEFRFFITAGFYGNGTIGFDNLALSHVDPMAKQQPSDPSWNRPRNADFNGQMDPAWTNWAGDLGAWWALPSKADFESVPGWIVLHGPADGFGLHLRHYPFMPARPYPFFAEMRLRYPTIDPPDANYMIMMSMQLDTDGDLLTDDIAYPSLVIRNIMDAQKTQARVETMSAEGQSAFIQCSKPDTDLPTYWDSGDLYMRVGLRSKNTMEFSYKFNQEEAWTVFYSFHAAESADGLGIPLGLDIIGPCAKSNWPKPPAPQCKADEVSFEIDAVHFNHEP